MMPGLILLNASMTICLKFFRTLATVCTAFSNIFVVLIVSFSFTSQSPILAVTPNMLPPRSSTFPSKGDSPLNTAENACLMISRTANKPLNVRLRFSDA